jgi:tetratricopeptide (TPR) repeat protein
MSKSSSIGTKVARTARHFTSADTLLRMLVIIPMSMTLSLASPYGASAALDSDDVGIYGSVMVTRLAREGAISMKKGAWGEAQGAYVKLIGMAPKQEDFYFGMYQASKSMQQWDQCMRALSELFDINPEYKEKMALEYGETLYHMNRYDEAEVWLKKALANVTQESFVEQKLKRLIAKSIVEKELVVGKIAQPKYEVIAPVAPRVEVKPEEVHAHTSKTGLNLENAYSQSEGIFVATFKNYEKVGDAITYFRPPLAHFHIEEYMKGPPLNANIPIRFEFHDKIGESKPEGWKFTEEMMPKKGSKWILYIPNCVPIDGMFETYHGKFGIQEYTDDNYDKIMRILELHKGQTR